MALHAYRPHLPRFGALDRVGDNEEFLAHEFPFRTNTNENSATVLNRCNFGRLVGPQPARYN